MPWNPEKWVSLGRTESQYLMASADPSRLRQGCQLIYRIAGTPAGSAVGAGAKR